MIAPACWHKRRRKYGKNRKGQQRHQCLDCQAVFTEEPTSPLGTMRIERERAERVLNMLCEGCSIRTVSRLTDTDQKTIMALLVLVGERCHRYMAARFQDLIVGKVEVDEVWQFIYCKEKNRVKKGYSDDCGDSYLFTAIERDTKLLFAYQMSKRTAWEAEGFCGRIAEATTGRFNLSTDGFTPYAHAVATNLRGRVDYGQVVKNYGAVSKDDQRKYSPAKIISCTRTPIQGEPKREDISTSIVERSNLTLRTFLRRMTRLTCGFSKKWL